MIPSNLVLGIVSLRSPSTHSGVLVLKTSKVVADTGRSFLLYIDILIGPVVLWRYVLPGLTRIQFRF